MKTIILNPKEAAILDYEANWRDLVDFETYLSIQAQRNVFESNREGYDRFHSSC